MNQAELPLVVFPRHSDPTQVNWSQGLRACAERYLGRLGSILFRGFRVPGEGGFRRFAESFGYGVLGRPQARAAVPGELAHATGLSGCWPARLWLHGGESAGTAGAIELADGREVFRRMPSRLRARLLDRGLLYVHEFKREAASALGMDRAGIEAWCSARGMGCEWAAEGGLTTRQRGSVALPHPQTGELVWFNRALESGPRARANGIEWAGETTLRVLYGDGGAIEEAALQEIRGVLSEVAWTLVWEAGDVLLLDNLLTAHALPGAGGGRASPLARAPDAWCAGPCFSLGAAGARWVERPRRRQQGGGRSAFGLPE